MAIYTVMNMQTCISKHLYMKQINVTVISPYHYQLVIQLGLTLCNLMDGSLPVPCVHGFSRPEYSSGRPFPSPGHLPNSGIELRSPALQADSLPCESPGKPPIYIYMHTHIYMCIPTIFISEKSIFRSRSNS